MYKYYRVNIGGCTYYSWAWSYKQARLNVEYRLNKKKIHDYFIRQMTKENDNNDNE